MIDRDRMIEEYVPYVRAIAGKVASTISRSIDFDDLVGFGKIGLVEAADRFDPRYGADFKTFAYYRIRGAIYDGLRGMGWLRPTEYARFKFERGAGNLMGNLADRGISSERGSLGEEVQAISDVVRSLASIFVVSMESVGCYDAPDVPEGRPDTILSRTELVGLVRKAIEELPDKERELIRLYYYEEKTLQEVGEELGLSKSWVSRLHSRAVERLTAVLSQAGVYDAE
ncbi:MAG: sigma-70 family RNA polymerase sigma factor [Candidatus Schekmanbacteria bacterium]|nr:sigma-70 family RNA polymerase sigma factor [Candidatus Schekmanbacteria bacterium]